MLENVHFITGEKRDSDVRFGTLNGKKNISNL